MVKNKKFIMLILQLAFMLLFVTGTYNISQKELKPTEVYVYTKRMNKNAELEASDFKKVQIPSEAVKKDFLTEKEFKQIQEGGMVMTTSVEAGQYAYKSQVDKGDKISPFEQLDLSKFRKVSIPVSYETAVSGEIKKGDKVDLIYVGEIEGVDNGVEKSGTYSNVFKQGVLVYSVTTKDGFEFVGHSQVKKSDTVNESLEDEEGNSSSTSDYEEALAMVTVAVPIADVEEITARLNTGKIQIVGRFDESVDVNSTGYYIGKDGNSAIYAGNKDVEKK